MSSPGRKPLLKTRLRKAAEEAFDFIPKRPMAEYRQGGEGCAAWIEDYCYIPIYPHGGDIAVWCRVGELPHTPHPVTGKSYWDMWCHQKEILQEALRMEDGQFVYSLIVLCWMRGEGKSLVACLVQLWKFFLWTRQQIMLGANSKDQTKFVHYDIMRDILLNSPELHALIGDRNIQEKEIRLTDVSGNIRSIIRSISTASGIVSNITGYTFSEIFDMKKPKFFVQLDGSIRNIPNALGVIDSTVSEKTHILYSLYEGAAKKKTKRVFFSYRFSADGKEGDYWNPNMTQDQLNDYREKFPFGEFERYFLNKWSAGQMIIFSEDMIEETKLVGIDGLVGNRLLLKQTLESKYRLKKNMDLVLSKGFSDDATEMASKIETLERRFVRFESALYPLRDNFGGARTALGSDLSKLTDVFDTDWAVVAGADFGDPYAVAGLARTILVVVAKGLIGSRTNPYLSLTEGETAKFLYVVLLALNISNHSVDLVKDMLEIAHNEYGGIDSFCSERYGTWDMEKWCKDRGIAFTPIFPTYERQRDGFKEVLMAVREGRWKCPELSLQGSKGEDLRDEEMSVFMHDSGKRWFGSPEKMEKYGIQDDFMFATCWGMYGGRMLGVENFRARKGNKFWGVLINGEGLLGDYRKGI
jgi:hypothetical protein